MSGHRFQRVAPVGEINDHDPLAVEVWRRRVPVFNRNELRLGEPAPKGPGRTESVSAFCVIEDNRGWFGKVVSRVRSGHMVGAYHVLC